MAKKTLTQATYAVNNIQNQPDQVVGSASALKLAFDQGDIDGKTFINGTLLTELADETLNNSGSNAIGHNSTSVTADNVGDALEEIKLQANTSVQTSGDQTVNGVKDFSSSPLVPTPTLDGQAANKSYVDGFAPLNIADNSITDQKLVDEGGIKSAVYDSFYSPLTEWSGNTKLGDDGQDVSDWTAAGGTLSQDTTNVKLGSGAIRITENDNIASTIAAYKGGISLDLSTLNNGEVSTDSDYINVAVYVTDVSKFSSARIYFDQSPTLSLTNSKQYDFYSLLSNGWNYLKILKSDFTTNGTGAWSGIQLIYLRYVTTTNAQNEYITFQLAQLVKKDPDSAIPNPFQRNGVRDKTINGGEFAVFKEFGQIRYADLSNPSFSITQLVGQNSFENFTRSWTNILDSVTNGVPVGWGTDNNNYIVGYVTANNIRLRKVEGGVPANFDNPVTGLISVGDKLDWTLKKEGVNVSLSVVVNGDSNNPITPEPTTTTLTSGFATIGTSGASNQRLLHDSITQIAHARHADEAEVATSLKILYNNGVFTANTLPFGTFGIDTLNNRLYVRKNATTVSYTALT